MPVTVAIANIMYWIEFKEFGGFASGFQDRYM